MYVTGTSWRTVWTKVSLKIKVVATRPEEQGFRIWRALETIGISDFVLSETVIGVLLLEM